MIGEVVCFQISESVFADGEIDQKAGPGLEDRWPLLCENGRVHP